MAGEERQYRIFNFRNIYKGSIRATATSTRQPMVIIAAKWCRFSSFHSAEEEKQRHKRRQSERRKGNFMRETHYFGAVHRM